MKKAVILVLLACSLAMNAQQKTEMVGTIKLGSDYSEALNAMKMEFGEPLRTSEDEVVYANKRFRGFTFDEVKFCFKNGKFNEARFFSKVGTKAEAQKKMENVAQTMKTKYQLSRDVEGDSTWFYKGGCSPLGIGHLFTLYTYPRKGAYGMEIRFGPINFPQ